MTKKTHTEDTVFRETLKSRPDLSKNTKFKIEFLETLFKEKPASDETNSKKSQKSTNFDEKLHKEIQQKLFQAQFEGGVRWKNRCFPSVFAIHHWRDFLPKRVFVREVTISPDDSNILGKIFHFVRTSQKRKAIIGFGHYHGRLKKIIKKEDVLVISVNSLLKPWKGLLILSFANIFNNFVKSFFRNFF